MKKKKMFCFDKKRHMVGEKYNGLCRTSKKIRRFRDSNAYYGQFLRKRLHERYFYISKKR